MDTILKNGDFALNDLGYPKTAQGSEALLQRAVLRLCIPQGSFDYDELLGSCLPSMKGKDEELAVTLARAALAPLPEAQVISTRVEEDCIWVALCIDDNMYEIEVKRNGDL